MNAELNSDWPLRTARFSLRENGTPVADEFDDIYFSTENGLAETRHVFIEGNDLPTRFAKLDPSSGPFTILETGFGTGLNFLATWQTFLALAPPSARLHFVSIEAHPFYAKDIVRLHKNSELAELARVLAEAWPDLVPGLHRRHFAGGRITLTLGFGDVRRLLPQMDLKADALFLDGFSPARNPAMWQPEVMCLLASLMNVGGSFATFTSARMVKDALAEGGFAFEKAPGYGRKRDMLKGILTRTPQPRRVEPALPMSITGDVGARQAIVIGAGLAGCAITSALAARGWRITLFERGSEPAQAASGNPAGIFLPVLSRDWNALSNLTGSATGYLRSEIARMNASGGDIDWSVCGVLRLARGDKHLAQQLRILETLKPDSSFAQWLTQDQASDLAGVSVNAPGWWFPGCGWVNPPSLCKAWLKSAAEATTAHFNKPVFKIEKHGALWRAFNEQGVVLAEAPVVIVANANEAAKFAATRHLPLIPFRGQISQLPISYLHSPAPRTVICREGYVIPPREGMLTFGASFNQDVTSCELTAQDHLENMERLREIAEPLANGINPALLGGRASLRSATPDRLPIVGPVTDPVRYEQDLAQWASGRWHRSRWAEVKAPMQEGLYVFLGHGARGLTWIGLTADWLASRLNNEPSPLPRNIEAAIHPARFQWRAMKRGR